MDVHRLLRLAAGPAERRCITVRAVRNRLIHGNARERLSTAQHLREELEKKSKLYKEEPGDPKDKWIAFYTNIDWVADTPGEEIDPESLTKEQREMPLTPLELADDFRARWGIETGYRKLKEDFLAKSRSTRYYIRVQVFYFAVLWYNMWLTTNVKRADELGIDLGDDRRGLPIPRSQRDARYRGRSRRFADWGEGQPVGGQRQVKSV